MAGRNSDGSYDAIETGGFGKDYHGQDAFGERFGGTGIGGSHFGGKAAGDFSDTDDLGEGHFTERYKDYGQVTQTENMPESAFEGEANEVADSMRESIRGVNETTENSNTGSMDTGFQIGGIEDPEREELEKAAREEYTARVVAEEGKSRLNKHREDINNAINQMESKYTSGSENNVIDALEKFAQSFGYYDEFDRNKIEEAYKEKGTEGLRNINEEISKTVEAYFDNDIKAAQDKYDKIKSSLGSYGSSFTDKTTTSKEKKSATPSEVMEEATSIAKTKADRYSEAIRKAAAKDKTVSEVLDMLGSSYDTITDKMEPSTTEAKPTETNEVADSMREPIQDIEEDKEKYQQELERAEEHLNETNEWAGKMNAAIAKAKESINVGINMLDDKSISRKIANTAKNVKGSVIDNLESLAKEFGYNEFDRNKIEEAYKEKGTEALRNASDEIFERVQADVDRRVKGAQGRRDNFKSIVDSYKSSTTDKTKTSFTEAKPAEAKPDTNMSNAKTSPSDYSTKANKDANKDSTKELPPSRNDFGNHAADTLKGVTDRITGSVTADALGLKSIEEFARENGYNPEKLSTMKAYQSYQNKEIMKAIPGIVKEIGSYITERVKDAVDPSQLGERVRNTLARYNLATLIGAAILSIKSGAGLQASIDQALTMVDTEDQPAVSDYLEDVLSDEGTVNDLGNAFDDALAPEQNSDTAELDELIVNIGRKDNTDYDDFNAGLGSSGTTSSDADVKVFIARNVKADPILRKMISKTGK